jgi:hypothetical protein
MAKFTLTSGSDTLDFDIDGSVSAGGKRVGNWRTTPENKIQVKKQDGSSSEFDAGWKFNTDGQLVLLTGSKEVFNFQSDASITPGFELVAGVLRFTPNRVSGFFFELRGEWDLVGNHDLQFTVNGRSSKLVGLINDAERKNRFLYIFKDNKRPLVLHRLQFEGHWETPATKEAALKFFYARADGTEDIFELPGDVVINISTNQLRYEYTKNGKQKFEFEGVLTVSPDFQITYLIGRTQTSTGQTVVRESSIQIGASFAKPNLTGILELTVRKQDGGSSTITIGGTFTAVLAKDMKLAAGFKFEQVRTSGLVTSTTFAFAGELKIKNAATVTWSFSTTNTTVRTINLAVGTEIKLGQVSVDARLNLTASNGQVQGVTFLLGVSF